MCRASRFPRKDHVAADCLLDPMFKVLRFHDFKVRFFAKLNQCFALGDMGIKAHRQHAAVLENVKPARKRRRKRTADGILPARRSLLHAVRDIRHHQVVRSAA